MRNLIEIITSSDPGVRNQPLESVCGRLSLDDLLDQASKLDDFRRRSENLYERVRALFFLYAIHRFHLPAALDSRSPHRSTASDQRSQSLIPFKGYEHLLQRR